ncbi:hypothetical protein CAPTEDRAFT_209479 [Capitella teleta]|uniref:F-box domain-containing protein n=1 Tax=Capitella teleta TaxID=283909 RepID=R7U835_CAPTE|nr:hypothetical protein CAPTEDRAFT_209479 [Capitella teleta]|eukprot:ELU02316.1 hypothetical protein CAPTEDRAFT_209479 [Capitella teleta]
MVGGDRSALRRGRKSGGPPCFLDLPDDAIFAILTYCDPATLGQLSLVCRRLNNLAAQDCVWLPYRRKLFGPVNIRKTFKPPSVKAQCEVAVNWKAGSPREVCLISYATKQIPWIQLYDDNLWVSEEQEIRCHPASAKGIRAQSCKSLKPGGQDISRFMCKDGRLVAATRCACISMFDLSTGDRVQHLQHCHQSDIHCIDFHGDVIVSGSRDSTVKMWRQSASSANDVLLKTVHIGSRIWSLCISPDARFLITGTAGWNDVAPLHLWDMNTGQFLGNLGENYQEGAGVLDVHFKDEHLAFTCGYDTYTRLWDLRQPLNKHVGKWEEPFDYTVYCVRSDQERSFVTGLSHHGLTRLWDIRHSQPLQMLYSSCKQSSPVYSLAFESSRMYVALDKAVLLFDFNRLPKSKQRRRRR